MSVFGSSFKDMNKLSGSNAACRPKKNTKRSKKTKYNDLAGYRCTEGDRHKQFTKLSSPVHISIFQTKANLIQICDHFLPRFPMGLG